MSEIKNGHKGRLPYDRFRLLLCYLSTSNPTNDTNTMYSISQKARVMYQGKRNTSHNSDIHIAGDAPTLRELQSLRDEVQALRTAERERDLALDAYEQERQRANTLQSELEYSRMQHQRTEPDRQELRRLQQWEASVFAIAAVSHDRLGPYSKLALITHPKQKPYPASVHGGDANTKLTSMKQWNVSIGGDENNTHCLARAIKPLEESGTVKKTPVDLGDGRSHYVIEVNENHLSQPRFISPGEPRPHNGGNKRCPQCNNFCKKKITLTYECVDCGLDFDANMNPIDHSPAAPNIEHFEERF